MTGIVITGHSHFAEGLFSALKLIVGEPENLICVNFEVDDSTEDLKEKLSHAYDELAHLDGVLTLCDLQGGSPYKTAVECKYSREGQAIEVVSGASLPMLIQAAMMAALSDDVTSLADTVIASGKEYIFRFQEEKPETLSPEEDGI